MTSVPELIIPDFGGGGTTSVLPALTWGVPTELIPESIARARQCVVLVVDSLGWLQLEERMDRVPTLAKLQGGAATTTAPSTTATALTSISTGVPPGEHGIVGYRFPAGGSVMNALRWSTPAGDHRQIVRPSELQSIAPLAGGPWEVVGDRQFIGSGFTEAHLGNAPYTGIWHPSSIVAAVHEKLSAGIDKIYCYYDGLDHVAHVHGFSGDYFNRELEFVDWLVGRMIDALPSGAALVVLADHGQIDAPEVVSVAPEVVGLSTGRSGEARFRWLHAKPGATQELAEVAEEMHGDIAWVRTKEQVIDEGWFGPKVAPEAANRLGDVALVAHAPIGFDDPGEPHVDKLVGRHGSLTPDEMLVPVLTHLSD